MRAIITYHSIDPSGSVISIDRETFRRHVSWLVSNGLRVTTIEELPRLAPDENAVAITFDDGFASFALVAWPLLRDHGLPATVFVVTDHVGGINAWEQPRSEIPTLPLLDWPELARLAEEGVAIGAHTRTHADLRALPPGAVADEVEGSGARIAAEIGRRPAVFAYPYGRLSGAVVSAVRASFSHACTMELRPLREGEDPLRLPRLDAHYLRRAGVLERWGSPGFAGYLWLRAQGRRVRRALAGSGAGP